MSYTARDIKEGNVPAFLGTQEFRKLFPINGNKLLEICNCKGAPAIRNGSRWVIKTLEMIEYIEKLSA